MSSTPLATKPAPTSPSQCVTAPSPTPGPITKLPLELLTHTLSCLFETCDAALDRQLESQRWLRVNRAFHDGYLLSEAAHERAIATGSQARALTRALARGAHAGATVRSLWVGMDEMHLDGVVGSMVAACGGELVRFEWCPSRVTNHVKGLVADKLVQAWKGCIKMSCFSFGAESRGISAGQAQDLLASWSKMVDLNLYNFDIIFDRDPRATSPPSLWTVPTHLRSVELYVDSADALALLGTLIKHSAGTLTHLVLEIYDGSSTSFHDVFFPVTSSLTSLVYTMGETGEGNVSYVSPVLAELRGLRTLQLPVGALETLVPVPAREDRRPLDRLELVDHTDSSEADLDDLLRFLQAVKVKDLHVSAAWWTMRLDLAVKSANEAPENGASWEEEASVEEVAADWLRQVTPLVGTLRLV